MFWFSVFSCATLEAEVNPRRLDGIGYVARMGAAKSLLSTADFSTFLKMIFLFLGLTIWLSGDYTLKESNAIPRSFNSRLFCRVSSRL